MGEDNEFTIIDTPYMAGLYLHNVMINYNYLDTIDFQVNHYLYVKDTIEDRDVLDSKSEWAKEATLLYWKEN